MWLCYYDVLSAKQDAELSGKPEHAVQKEMASFKHRTTSITPSSGVSASCSKTSTYNTGSQGFSPMAGFQESLQSFQIQHCLFVNPSIETSCFCGTFFVLRYISIFNAAPAQKVGMKVKRFLPISLSLLVGHRLFKWIQMAQLGACCSRKIINVGWCDEAESLRPS